jgi:hypothetical protein
VGSLRVLRDILREKGILHTVYGDRHISLRRNDKHWTWRRSWQDGKSQHRWDETHGVTVPRGSYGATFSLSL